MGGCVKEEEWITRGGGGEGGLFVHAERVCVCNRRHSKGACFSDLAAPAIRQASDWGALSRA